MNYISGLNGIRAIAVFLVIISHRFPRNHFLKILPIDDFGVDVFFVLSGFLITRILFVNLKKNNFDVRKNLRVFKIFLLRRAIRIFPIYYITLLILYLTGGTIGNNFTQNINWYLFYGVNYLNFTESKWFGSLAHLWSLSVEEQFYLLWPILLLFIIKKNKILSITILFIIIGTVYPFFFDGLTKVLTIGCLNAFGIGILLAYTEIFKPKWVETFLRYLNYSTIPIIALIIINYTYSKIPFFSIRLANSLLALRMISFFVYNPTKNYFYKFLNSKVLFF